MRFDAYRGRPAVLVTTAAEVTNDVEAQQLVHLSVGGQATLLDENHATALALALQAAVAEIQARAVGR